MTFVLNVLPFICFIQLISQKGLHSDGKIRPSAAATAFHSGLVLATACAVCLPPTPSSYQEIVPERTDCIATLQTFTQPNIDNTPLLASLNKLDFTQHNLDATESFRFRHWSCRRPADAHQRHPERLPPRPVAALRIHPKCRCCSPKGPVWFCCGFAVYIRITNTLHDRSSALTRPSCSLSRLQMMQGLRPSSAASTCEATPPTTYFIPGARGLILQP